ncbi:MAG: agmatine deiminase family protein [Planctomycetaceae bacterium]
MNEIDLLNYRWPAEWEPHAATWVAWPVNPDTWPGLFDRIPVAFANFVAAIAKFEPVNVLVSNSAVTESARQLLDSACERSAATFDVRLIDIPVNDSWCRDYGPIFLNRSHSITEGPSQVIIDWGYNSWGGKYPPWDKDAAVATSIASRLQIPAVTPGIILEGGAIEGNGAGTLLTTENCLLNPNRNPDLSRSDMEAVLRRFLNVETIVWLPGHGIIGDDTDGHIDQVARFLDEETVLVAAPYDSDADEASDLRANFDAVADINSLRAMELPMPGPKFQQGHRLPACYCNLYIANGGIIVPTFGDPADDNACGILQTAFPSHQVIGVDAIDLIWGLGAFHCMTQQQPRGPQSV